MAGASQGRDCSLQLESMGGACARAEPRAPGVLDGVPRRVYYRTLCKATRHFLAPESTERNDTEMVRDIAAASGAGTEVLQRCGCGSTSRRGSVLALSPVLEARFG